MGIEKRKIPPREILVARRALEGLRGVRLLDDWEWNPDINKWILHYQLSVKVADGGMVPASTEWYVLIRLDWQ